MAHFAKLDSNNIVTFVTVGKDGDTEQELFERTGEVYKQTSYNTYGGVHRLGGMPFRKNFAGIGYYYDENLDAFIPPKPPGMNSWILNVDSCLWFPPISEPNDEKQYTWNEQTISWIEVIDNPI